MINCTTHQYVVMLVISKCPALGFSNKPVFVSPGSSVCLENQRPDEGELISQENQMEMTTIHKLDRNRSLECREIWFY